MQRSLLDWDTLNAQDPSAERLLGLKELGYKALDTRSVILGGLNSHDFK